MGESINNRITRIHHIVLASSVVLIGYIAIFLRNRLPPQMPLFYSRPWGEEQLANPIELIIPFLLIMLCGGLFQVVKKIINDKILERLMMGGIVVIEILILLAVLRIVFLIS